MIDIKVRQIYDYYDDGKIRKSRKCPVTINEIIAFPLIDKETLIQWENEVEECHWLYSKETDYFIKGTLDIHDGDFVDIVFVRTNDNTWFSMGDWSGELWKNGQPV